MAIQRQVVLECVQPSKGHNKYYEITIRDQRKDSFEVYSRWGRIEHFKDGNPQMQTKAENCDWDEAMTEVGVIMAAKQKKGYKIVKDSAVNVTKPVKFTVQVPEKEFDRTEHVETIVSDWWLGSDDIEERAI